MWKKFPKPEQSELEKQIAESKRLVEQSKEILARPDPILLGKTQSKHG